MGATETLRAAAAEYLGDTGAAGVTELSKVSGVDRSNLAKFLSGERGMTLDGGVRLSEVIGVDLREGVPETAIVHVPREKPKPVPVTPRPSTPSSYCGGPKRADDRPALTEAMKTKKRKQGMPTDT